jgi:hypothetical protein
MAAVFIEELSALNQPTQVFSCETGKDQGQVHAQTIFISRQEAMRDAEIRRPNGGERM